MIWGGFFFYTTGKELDHGVDNPWRKKRKEKEKDGVIHVCAMKMC